MDADASSSVPPNSAFTLASSSSSPFHNFGTATSTSTAAPTASAFIPPSSILVIGSGVFGLSTAYALTRRDVFSKTTITVVDRASAPASSTPVFPARDASSIDTSRIIRGDYADPAYATLATEALRQWRKVDSPDALGAQGRYNESGLVLVADAEPKALSTLTSPTPSEVGVTDTGASLLEQHNAKKTGIDYVRASWENAVALGAQDPELASRIRLLPNPDSIREAVGTGGTSGTQGYINKYAGWADAEKSMDWLYSRVQATGRVSFVSGTVSALTHTRDTVTGATLTSGEALTADLVILATGAWTASLLDLSGQATATGQVLAYMPITDEDQSSLSKMPVLLNLTTGLFIIPPSNNVLKVARHAYGYLNPATPTPTHRPLPPSPFSSSSSSSPPSPVSQPRTNLTSPPALAIPAEGTASLRSALREMLPSHPQLHDRPFSQERLCWYTDTPTGDFLISYHPGWRGLFVATGGSGHGFKFLPVLGDKIVDAVEGRTPEEFADKWAWKERREGQVVTEDGSRGGRPGLVLDEEMGKGGTA